MSTRKPEERPLRVPDAFYDKDVQTICEKYFSKGASAEQVVFAVGTLWLIVRDGLNPDERMNPDEKLRGAFFDQFRQHPLMFSELAGAIDRNLRSYSPETLSLPLSNAAIEHFVEYLANLTDSQWHEQTDTPTGERLSYNAIAQILIEVFSLKVTEGKLRTQVSRLKKERQQIKERWLERLPQRYREAVEHVTLGTLK